MRIVAVPVGRIDLSNGPCSLPPTRQLLIITKAFYFMYKTDISIKDFHHEGLDHARIFFIQEPAPNTIKSRLRNYLVLNKSTFIQPKQGTNRCFNDQQERGKLQEMKAPFMNRIPPPRDISHDSPSISRSKSQ